ncbi:MAG: SPFH domain-containing protein [Chloroflexota bacterium]|nr:SPFH domain-containing protein [Chloroflexota bacterium]
MAILDVIEFLDSSGQQIVHRVPEGGSGEFRLGSQLVVRESQAAVFFRDGKALDIFGPGRHTLSTANIPLLTGLLSIPFGGKSPFRAEVIFVNLADLIDMKWGTMEPVTFRDSEFGMVRLRAFGTYAMAVADPQLFVNKVVGTQGLYETTQIQDYLRTIIVSRFNDLLGQTMKTLLDLPSHYNEMGAGLKAAVADDYANLGLALKAFYITSITPPEEVQKRIDERTGMGVVGNMQQYMQYQAAQAMGGLAHGGSGGDVGGAANAGLGLGAGMGVGAGMAQIIAQGIRGDGSGGNAGGAGGATTQPGPSQSGQQSTPAAATMTCYNCHAQIPANTKFCPECGANQTAKACPNCSTSNLPNAKFCINCGTKLE